MVLHYQKKSNILHSVIFCKRNYVPAHTVSLHTQFWAELPKIGCVAVFYIQFPFNSDGLKIKLPKGIV